MSGSVAPIPAAAGAVFFGDSCFARRIAAYVKRAWEYVLTGKSYHVWNQLEEEL